jgi:hypothetical protein
MKKYTTISSSFWTRVARWCIFIPKIPTWVHLGELEMQNVGVLCWCILWQFGIFYTYLVYFVVIWYILWSFGIFCGQFGIFCGHLVYFVVIWYTL